MDKKVISMLSGGALLALTSTAFAGPMPAASESAIAPPVQTEQVHYYRHGYYRHGYYRHHYRHYGYYGHRHRYGYARYCPPRHRYRYGYRHRGYGYAMYRPYRYGCACPSYGYYRRGLGYGYYPGAAGASIATGVGDIFSGALGLAAAPFTWATGGYPYSGYPYYY
jgi:hypothetical protein